MFGMLEGIIVSCTIAFLAVIFVTPKLMKFLIGANIIGIDQQKKGKPLIPSSGGLAVAFGLLAGLMLFIAMDVFIFKFDVDFNLLFAASNTILIILLVGVLDDLNVKATSRIAATGTREYRVGLKQWMKPLLTLPAAIPLMVINAGVSQMVIPFIGPVDFGIIYPLILIPIAVVVVSNVNNMLAGLNGLEAGLGFIASLSVGVYALFHGNIEGAIIVLVLASSLLAFLKYNWFPAKILPGDSLTYLIGVSFVTAVIIANVEMFAVVVYMPWIIEALLKLRKRFAASSLGTLQKNGTLKSQYKKYYSLTHVIMGGKGRFTEKQVTSIILLLEIVFCLLAFVLFF